MLETFAQVRTRLRLLLQDPTARVWSDSRLDEYIEEGQEEYAKRTKSLRRSIQIYPHPDTGVYSYPIDFLWFMYAYDPDYSEVAPAGADNLAMRFGDDFDSETGNPVCLYDNRTSDGTFKLYKVPESDAAWVECNQEEGIVVAATGMTFSQETGAVVATDGDDDSFLPEPGAVVAAVEFTNIATLHYTRKPVSGEIEIDDPLALVFFAASKAFKEETEWRSVNRAKALYDIFDGRVAQGGNRQRTRAGRPGTKRRYF